MTEKEKGRDTKGNPLTVSHRVLFLLLLSCRLSLLFPFLLFFFLIDCGLLNRRLQLILSVNTQGTAQNKSRLFFFVFEWKGVILIECLHTLVVVQILQSHYLALHSPCRRHS